MDHVQTVLTLQKDKGQDQEVNAKQTNVANDKF